MAIAADGPFQSLIGVVRSFVSWGESSSDNLGVSTDYWMPDSSFQMCYECDLRFSAISRRHNCHNCGRLFCFKCMHNTSEVEVKFCKLCSKEAGEMKSSELDEKLDLFEQAFDFGVPGARMERFLRLQDESLSSPHAGPSSRGTSSIDPFSPFSFQRSESRSDDVDGGDSGKQFLSHCSEFCPDMSDAEGVSMYNLNDMSPCKSMESSPQDCPSKISGTTKESDEGKRFSPNSSFLVQESLKESKRPNADDLENSIDSSYDLSMIHDQSQNTTLSFDFENNGLIWFPPPPEGDKDDGMDNFFDYDDEDDVFSSNSLNSESPFEKDKWSGENEEPVKAVVHGHFRALVLQLLKGEGICTGTEDSHTVWLDIVSSLAWKAANFVRPNTGTGGSMDPGDYVKVKCVLFGSPYASTLVRGVVCTKNIKHKRMTSQYRNPKLLLLGGSLEYQRLPNQLASMDTLLQQEIDHLKTTVAKIEKHRPNVLLVERSVSSYAQEYLRAKEISLVLNVKRPLLERISRCTGANIVTSTDNLASARLGRCEVFRLEKVGEVNFPSGQAIKKSNKTLMFFEGCPRRLGCTVLLKGNSLKELKKVKHVMQYAVFAAYHLSLETSFLADEGASLPMISMEAPFSLPENVYDANVDTFLSFNSASSSFKNVDTSVNKVSHLYSLHFPSQYRVNTNNNLESEEWESASGIYNYSHVDTIPGKICDLPRSEWSSFSEVFSQVEGANRSYGSSVDALGPTAGASADYFTSADNNHSILVSLSSRCILKGTVCERSQLLRIKFYGSFDKPLGRFLRDDLFDQRSSCRSCSEPVEAHMRCYTHQLGSLSISVKRLPSMKLPGELDGKIWMWHRCLKCALVDGVPPATRRVVMSDAAWGLSFGKFLELSFSNHATANRVASCGHSLQRDCLRYYGCGSMVAFFRYSPIDILAVHLPSPVLHFGGKRPVEWLQQQISEVLNTLESVYAEIFNALEAWERKNLFSGIVHLRLEETRNHFLELKELLHREKNDYEGLIQSIGPENNCSDHATSGGLELSHVKRCLLIDSYMWDRRLSLLDSFGKTQSTNNIIEHIYLENVASPPKYNDLEVVSVFIGTRLNTDSSDNSTNLVSVVEGVNDVGKVRRDEDTSSNSLEHSSDEMIRSKYLPEDDRYSCGDSLDGKFLENSTSSASNLSEKIDLAWSGSDLPSELGNGVVESRVQLDEIPLKRVLAPVRVHSFDSALRFREKLLKGLPSASLHLSNARSFNASRDIGKFVHDPITSRLRTYSINTLVATQKLNFKFGYTPVYISSASRLICDGGRLLLPLTGPDNFFVAVYDNEPSSIIAYALSSKEYVCSIADKPEGREGLCDIDNIRYDENGSLLGNRTTRSSLSAWASFNSLEPEDIQVSSNYASSEAISLRGGLFSDHKSSHHLRITFGDESSLPLGRVKFSVTCYFAKQFDSLRKKCCPNEIDFIRSLSRCKRWSAQGGKSNVYFAKTLDERFIIKQVTKTELESFEEFAPEYFKYLMDSFSSGSHTCLAKVLGIYQVSVKRLKGGKEIKMDLMVMENLFFQRNISKTYDLKGSMRARYNSDTSGNNQVMLDLNLLEALRTSPMFLAKKAKRKLERAIWNDTAFLAAIDVMDYSLLVGVDEERNELVLGIIDFMRQYTWDKHLETWVKASGILGGLNNESPTVISPKQYKKRFRKAMSTYFLTVPDQWPS